MYLPSLFIILASHSYFLFFFFNDTATTEIYTLSLHDALPIYLVPDLGLTVDKNGFAVARASLCGYDNALSVALLRAAARRVGLILGPAKARKLVDLAQRPSGRSHPLGAGWSAEVAFDQVHVRRSREDDVGCALERISPSGERGSGMVGGFEISWSPDAAPDRIERATWTTWLDSTAWEVRPPARGHAVVPLRGVGHRPL